MGAVVAGAVFTAGTAAYAVTAFVVNLAVSYVIGRILAPDAPSMSGESRELKRTIRAPASPRRIIYGETLCGGNLIFAESTGSTNQYLHMVIAYAGHQVDNIGDIYINDTISTDARFGAQNATVIVIGFLYARFLYCDTPTNVTYHIEVDGVEYSNASIATLAAALPTGQYTATAGVGILTLTGNTPGSSFTVNRAWREADCDSNGIFVESTPAYKKETQSNALLFLNKHNGVPDQEADSDLVSNVPQWTTAHQLQGIAYLYIRLRYDDSAWLTGIPEVRAVVRGKQVYNPVTEQWAWTDNWALCVRDYLTSSFGLSCADTEIESALMSAAISTSDEEVVHPGPGRYKYEWGWSDIADLAGWSTTRCTLTTDTTDPYHNNILITPSAVDPSISKTSLSVDGYVHYKVRALIKRVTGTSWQGICYYSTSGHSWSNSYRKNISMPDGIDSGWVIAEWDMSALSVGGTDWIDNTVTGIRLDLGEDATTQYRVAFVSVSKPFKRYTCNGAFALDQKPADIMDKILTAGAGSLVFSQGKYRLYAGEYHTPTVTLDESDLRGPIKIRPRQSRKELFNEVKGLYIEPNQFWESIEFPIVQNSTYVTQDNDETITREIELPFTQDPYTAQRIAKIHLEKSRQGITIEYPCKLTALQLSAMDTVMVNNTAFGWSSKVFRILSWSLSSDGGVDLVMQEEAAAVYDWNNGNATFADPAPDTNLPSPWTLTAPDTMALDSSATHHISNVDGSTSVRIYVTWNKTDDRQKGFDVEYKVSSQSNWTRNSTFIPDEYDYVVVPIDGTNYDVRVRGVSAIGVSSDWVTGSSHAVPTGNIAQDTANVGGTPAADVLNDLAQALSDASNAQATADGKIQSFYQTTAPASGMAAGDLWIDTDDGNKLYRYSGSAWVDIQDDSITTAQSTASTAITDAATAQATADGKVTTFYTASTPTADGVGDLWVKTDTDEVYRWSGSAWNQINFDFGSVSGTTKPDDNADVTQAAIQTGITVTAGFLRRGTDEVLIDWTNRRVTIGDETYGGTGIQLEYNSGSPRSYTGNGDTKYIEFDGTDVVLGEDSKIKGVSNMGDTDVIFLETHFESLDGYVTSTSGSGTVVMDTSFGPGCVLTTASSDYAAILSQRALFGYGDWSKKRRVAIYGAYKSISSTDNRKYWVGIGAYDIFNPTDNEFVGFELDCSRYSGAGSGWIRGCWKKDGVSLTYQTAYYATASQSTPHKFDIKYDPVAQTAEFFINSTSIGSLSSVVIDTSIAENAYFCVAGYNSAACSNAGGLYLTRMKFWQDS